MNEYPHVAVTWTQSAGMEAGSVPFGGLPPSEQPAINTTSRANILIAPI